MLRAQLVQLLDDLDRAQLLAVDGYRDALLVIDGDVFGLIGRLLGGGADQVQVFHGLVPRIFQITALMAQVPEVAVHGVGALLVQRNVQTAGFGVFDFLFAGLDVPDAPRSDDLHLRSQRLDGQFEADLIVALAGRAVADGGSALGLGDLNQTLGDDRTGKAGAQQVLLLVNRAHLQGRPDAVGDELFADVFNIDLARAGLDGLLVEGGQLFALTYVNGDGDNVVVIVLLQPRDDNRGIQTARVSKNNFFLSHGVCLQYIFQILFFKQQTLL